MRAYILIGVLKGVIDSIDGFTEAGEAEIELAKLRHELNIIPGHEEESENDAQLHKLDIEDYPPSVKVRRMIF